jgi:hypothetical protein
VRLRAGAHRCAVAALAVCAALMIAGPVYAEGISGTYIGKNPTSAFLIQIVQTSDGRLTGHYAHITLQANGKLQKTNASITGASDGHTVALTIQSTVPLSGSLSLSGTIDGSLMHVSGGGYAGTLDLNLFKADETNYRAQVADLTRQAEQINAKHAMDSAKHALETALNRVESLTTQMATYSAQLPSVLAKFPPLNQRYRAITEAMRGGLARQQSIYGNGQASVARGQLDVAINQAGVEANQLHISVQSAYTDFNIKSSASLRLIAEMQKTCQTANATIDDTALLARWNAACLKLTTTIPDFQKHVGILQDAFSQTEGVWQEERVKQELLIRSADSAH